MPDTPEQTKIKTQILAAINERFSTYHEKELSELMTDLKALTWTKIKTFLKARMDNLADERQASSDGSLAEKQEVLDIKDYIDNYQN